MIVRALFGVFPANKDYKFIDEVVGLAKASPTSNWQSWEGKDFPYSNELSFRYEGREYINLIAFCDQLSAQTPREVRSQGLPQIYYKVHGLLTRYKEQQRSDLAFEAIEPNKDHRVERINAWLKTI